MLRLDAVAFIWKQLGTSCENLPEAHLLIQAFNAVARIAAPALLFKSEAIVHPMKWCATSPRSECQLSYNPLLMALLWNSLATREVKLLARPCATASSLPAGCAWVNYVRCHDDIGWTFSDEDALLLGRDRLRPSPLFEWLLHRALPGQLCPGPAVPGKSQDRRLPHLGHLRFAGRAGESAERRDRGRGRSGRCAALC